MFEIHACNFTWRQGINIVQKFSTSSKVSRGHNIRKYPTVVLVSRRLYSTVCTDPITSIIFFLINICFGMRTGASFEGGWWGRPPPKKKEKKKEKREKSEKKRIKERKKGTLNNVKLLHTKCCFNNFSIDRWHWKIKKIVVPPQEKVEMTPLHEKP